jgi:hypothetical protein
MQHTPFSQSFASSGLSTAAAYVDTPEVSVSIAVEDGERMQDDIKTEYHPHSGLQSHIQRFQMYGTSNGCDDNPPIPTEPWRPFRSRLDFEVAELALATYMNDDEVNTLCSLIHRAASGFEKFSIEGSKDLNHLWQLAASKRTQVYYTLSFLFLSKLSRSLVPKDACDNRAQGQKV